MESGQRPTGKFSPKFIHMRDKNGRLVPLKNRAEAIADYLEQKHVGVMNRKWAKPESKRRDS